MNALIVCHAGVGLGLGHLTRSLVVARALREELGAKVHLLIQGDPVRRADLDEVEHHFVTPAENLLSAISQQCRQLDAQVLILDLHPRLVPAGFGVFLEDFGQGSRKVISVDGLFDHHGKLDLIFVPSFHFSASADSMGVAPILFGWDCFLLNVRRSATAWHVGTQVLALAGGGDATGLGKTLPALLNAELPDDTVLHWVTGPYAQQPDLPAYPRFSILNHQSPPSLDDLMVGSNYTLTVYGVSFFESLYYGRPTVVFSPYGSKNDAELAAIAEAGVAVVAADEVDAVAKLKRLMADDALAASLSERARQKLAGSGGRKLARAVAQLLA